MLVVVGAVVLVIAVGAAVWLLAGRTSTGKGSNEGCVTVSIASTMGGAVERACGSAARDWCRAVSGAHDAHAQAVQAQCRVAGLLP